MPGAPVSMPINDLSQTHIEHSWKVEKEIGILIVPPLTFPNICLYYTLIAPDSIHTILPRDGQWPLKVILEKGF